ncbi:hypothetical protein [Spirosoma oryzicola]|uniref:hypothetical protein n=1 Tax=Spirosoma oryzicola TaxID=2898794 RepID=UPI001E302CD1|nr:hypothetical protein [Spirosoma oryzicola]UHG93294.1 hypothetical protein LQ777_10415 [Spirosoma oryzicola]
MKHEIQQVEIRYQFTQDELNLMGPVIARLSQDWQEKEDEKKAVMSDFKHQIDAIKQQFNEMCNRLNNRFEMREVRARMIKNYKTYEREYYSLDTFDLVKTEPFRPSDYQRDIDDTEEMPFGQATDPTPEAAGTAETNPAQYAHLIRELNFWRDKMKALADVDDQDHAIDQGVEISAKIKELESVLSAMEPESPNPDEQTGADENSDTGESTDE